MTRLTSKDIEFINDMLSDDTGSIYETPEHDSIFEKLDTNNLNFNIKEKKLIKEKLKESLKDERAIVRKIAKEALRNFLK